MSFSTTKNTYYYEYKVFHNQLFQLSNVPIHLFLGKL